MKSIKLIKIRPSLMIFVLGVLLVIAGLVVNVSFVAKFKKEVETHRGAQDLILSGQLMTITLGHLVIIASLWVYNKRYLRTLSIPLLVLYGLLIYSPFVEKYPNHILFKPRYVRNFWNVLVGRELFLSDYQPKSMLVVENRRVTKAKFPAIDVHYHFGSMKNLTIEDFLKAMDSCGITQVVNLDGWLHDFADKYPDRCMDFAAFSLSSIKDDPDFSNNQVALLEKNIATGARGIKIQWNLGLRIHDKSGNLVAINDPRLDPIWDRAGDVSIPVMMHLTNPTAFFYPVDRFNERYQELTAFIRWSYYGPKFPTKEDLLLQRENLIRKHPKTIIIGAHMGMNPDNLAYVGYLFDKYPNYYVDMSSVMSDLGRQPFTARRFFIKYQDRILFGTDAGYGLGTNGWSAERYYRTHFEFLETENEYFEYPLWGIHNQGMWRVYGINLPDEVLEKIYYKNAAKILGLHEGKHLSAR